jgi:mannose-6-phosphate isomerase-like protein (cupin superfamily)
MATVQTQGFRVGRNDDRLGEYHDFGIGVFSVKVTTEDSGGGLLACELVHHTKGGPWRHFHNSQDEWFYVVEGEYIIEVGDARFTMRSGDSAYSPPRVPHAWAHVGEGTGRIAFVLTPAGRLEAFFRELTTFRGMAPPDPAFWHRYDMELVGPPLSVTLSH